MLNLPISTMAYGVTGNTSGFGPEESRFEPQQANEFIFVTSNALIFWKNFIYLRSIIEKLKGDIVPLFIKYSLVLNKILENLITDYFEKNPSFFLVDSNMNSSNKISIIIDGDQGVKISDCVSLGKYLRNNLVKELHDFSFEVSSAGLTSPLIYPRQFIKNLNRKLNIQSINGEEFTGNLSEVNNDNVKIEWFSREPKPLGKGKISVLNNKSLLFNEIKEAKLIVEF